MDEREFRDQLVRLAEPISTTPRAMDAVADRVVAKRRTRNVGLVVAAGLALVAGGAAAVHLTKSGPPTEPTGVEEVDTVRLSAFANAYGVEVSITTSFDDDRRIVSGGIVRAGREVDDSAFVFADVAGYDDDDPYPFTLPADTDMKLIGYLQPSCADPPPEEIVFELHSVRDGEATVDTFVPSNLSAYESALTDWCDQDAQVMTGNASITTDGIAKVEIVVINPGPDPVSVEVREFSAEGAHWDAASITAAPGKTTRLVLHGTGVGQNASQPTPWESGYLLIDGKPYEWTDTNSWI
jgi:hypothetical protein